MTSLKGDIEQKLEALLEQNPHENERYLACCTLLIRTQPSCVGQILDDHPNFRQFVIGLIRTEADISLIMKRVGIRVLTLYLSTTDCEGGVVEANNWGIIVMSTFVKRCRENKAIEIVDAELLHLISLGIVRSGNFDSDDLIALPDLIMERFCNCSDTSSGTETDASSQEIGTAFILRKVLDGQNDIGVSPGKAFGDEMIQYMAAYVEYLSTSEIIVQTPSILTCAFVKNSTTLLFTSRNDNFPAISSLKYRYILHYALLAFISGNVAGDLNQNDFDLKQKLATAEDEILNVSMQRLVLSGITSLLDSTESKDANEKDGKSEQKLASDVTIMIRTMTIQLLSDLLDSAGIKWMKSTSQQGSLGDASALCMMTRLVAGELRIVLGTLVDRSLMVNNPDKDVMTDIAPKMDEGILQRCRACIRIGLFTLKTMLQMAPEQNGEDSQSLPAIPFNADSILHIRHTLEDYLDSCIQFMLEDVNRDAFEGWPECAVETCRYLGAYLAQVNVFDYDSLDDTNNGEEDDDDGDRKRTTTTNLLRAMSNGLTICSDISSSREHVAISTCNEMRVTLFPSLLSTLTCCENSRQMALVRKYLFRNMLISSLIENILKETIVKGNGALASLYASIDSISWCCLLIGAILDFESIDYSPTKIMNKESLIKEVTSVSSHALKVGKAMVEDDMIINTMLQLFDCWMALVDRTDYDTDSAEMMRVHSFLRVNGAIEL